MKIVEQKEYEFWPDKIADGLIRDWKAKKQVINTGTSMSGEPHIGSANDVIRGDAIRLALQEKVPAELIWISDNLDPFRSVPADMPKELEDYLGMPASSIPDFWKCHKSFTEHFESKFIEQLKSVFVNPTVMLGSEMYKKGMYNDVIKIAMQKKDEIAEILNQFREHKLSDDWYPVDIICEKCKKISTTRIFAYDPKTAKAKYVCRKDEIILHRKNPVAGCGHEGEVSILDGNSKLTWRVEWAARWVFLESTCEPFGKEHAAAGGSWDTGKEIAEKIFNYKPPYPVEYEHFLVNGEKMSKSKGNVITVPDMLKFMTPAMLRYWMFQGRLTIAKNIVIEKLVPNLFDEFNRAEEVYFHPEKFDKKEQTNLARAYQLSVINPEKEGMHVEFDMLKGLVSVAPEGKELEFVANELEKKDLKIVDDLEEKVKLVKNYIQSFEKKAAVEFSDKEREALKEFAVKLAEVKTEDDVQNVLKEAANDTGLSTREMFKAIYKALFSKETGPRLGQYVMQVGMKETINKLNQSTDTN
ncbi:lysine--tRNA ligase [archaeon]|nr:MAG: lysine--tRNA ligase [archaeon]